MTHQPVASPEVRSLQVEIVPGAATGALAGLYSSLDDALPPST